MKPYLFFKLNAHKMMVYNIYGFMHFTVSSAVRITLSQTKILKVILIFLHHQLLLLQTDYRCVKFVLCLTISFLL